MARVPGADQPNLQQIANWIASGVTLDMEATPLAEEYDNTPSVRLNADVVRSRLREYMDFGAVILLPQGTDCPLGVQPLHVIIKPDRKPRLVIDLSRNLNTFLRYEYFSYSSVRDATELSSQGCWYGKLDLSNCFLSFPLHPSAQPHFIFRFEGQLYQFVCMPFGLASAPRVCTQLLSVVAHRLAMSGVQHVVRYLDDFLFISHSERSMTAILGTAQQLFSDFGLVVNTDKTEGPAQQISFLGIQLDSLAQTMSCTPARLAGAECTARLGPGRTEDPSFVPRHTHRQTTVRCHRTAGRPPVPSAECSICSSSTTDESAAITGATQQCPARRPVAGCTSHCSTAACTQTTASEPTLDSGSHTSTSGMAQPSGAPLRRHHSA